MRIVGEKYTLPPSDEMRQGKLFEKLKSDLKDQNFSEKDVVQNLQHFEDSEKKNN